MAVSEFINNGIVSVYNAFLQTLPTWAQNFLTLFLLVILVFIYAVGIWKFYRFVARKNIIKLNLNKYNKFQHVFTTKVVAVTFYFLEYIIIMPLLIFFWFALFTIFLILLTEGIEIPGLLIISATIIAAIRMTAYYKEELSREIAKLLPFTLLAIAITKPNFFNLNRIITHLVSIPSYLPQIFIYLLFIVALEIILRIFEFIFSLLELGDAPKIEEQENQEEKE